MKACSATSLILEHQHFDHQFYAICQLGNFLNKIAVGRNDAKNRDYRAHGLKALDSQHFAFFLTSHHPSIHLPSQKWSSEFSQQ
jgi:hypothetical protein